VIIIFAVIWVRLELSEVHRKVHKLHTPFFEKARQGIIGLLGAEPARVTTAQP
jgi:hypothetical protein